MLQIGNSDRAWTNLGIFTPSATWHWVQSNQVGQFRLSDTVII